MSGVSVLIPCRNAEPFLAETIQSALDQTLSPREVIVVDDGSTDGSRAIASAYGDRVTLLTGPARGASEARNAAMRAAGGEFLQFLDADDILERHALASRAAALEQTRCDVAISDWARLSLANGVWTQIREESGRPPTDAQPLDVAIFRGFWAPPAAILYRRSLCDRIGPWRSELRVIQDARYLLDAASVGGRFAHVPGVGAQYRQHDSGSLSTRDSLAFWRDVFSNALDVKQTWRAAQRLDDVHVDALVDVFSNCARIGFHADRQLFDDAQRELTLLGHVIPSKFVRAAMHLTRWVGYSPARALLTPFRS